jgi:hypothetical protein
MNKLFFIFFLCFPALKGISQEIIDTPLEQLSEEDEIINNLLLEENIDDFLTAINSSDYLYFSVNYRDKTYFSGRDIGIDQYSVIPQFMYIHHQGFFASISGVYYSEFAPNWDYTSLSVGYRKSFGKNKQYRWLAYYDRYFFSQSGDHPLENGINIGLAIDNKTKTIGTEIIAGLLFGQEESPQITSSSYGEVTLWKQKKHTLLFRPEIDITLAKETIQLAETYISHGREFTVYTERNRFGLINTQITLPLQYTTADFDFEIGYEINFPSPLEDNVSPKPTNTFLFSIAYLWSL